MNRSKIAQKDRDDMLALCKRMTPEERLAAFFHHSQLVHQIYEAGVRSRSASTSKQDGTRQQ
jgi:hypothetical protein